ncbi:mechanosensitive ion channel family protein [Azospirillum picis]|uniref:Small-conductance mechanosensitive channel n=1 Tax=Azospirillum picis TaxID=488438 RepID=A0ABU0MHK8_9PROT|nr:mechanosensitive ion channel family protein [Azospirillum picis]MBP2298955.1 small-conductance mechanosensitive channel [Azospirillum picis]MDQ0532803.1 small-conductance mechanosensitive channel [Azospirillum picis]
MNALRRLSAPVLVLAILGALAAAKPWLHVHLDRLAGPGLSTGFDLAVAAAAWLVAAWVGSRVIDLLAAGSSGSNGGTNGAVPRQPRIPRLLSDLLRFLVYGVAVVGILAFVLNQPVTGLLATSGVAIAVLGFALRNMIADIFAGIALNIEHPYRIGDWLELSPGVSGRVDEINWRATRLIASDGTALIVPNGIVAGSRFVNFSWPNPAFRTTAAILLDSDIPVERAKRILLSALLCADGVLPTPQPDVIVDAVTPNGINYLVRFWIDDGGRVSQVRDAVLSAALSNLAHAGVEPARPKQESRPRADAGVEGGSLRRSLLRRLELFDAFDDPEIEALGRAMRRRLIAAGSAAVRQGDAGESLFVIAEGVFDVQVAAADPGGRPAVRHLTRLRPGELFGEMSLLTGQPRSASVVACTDAVIFELERSHLDPVLRRRPELAERLAELMADRQSRNNTRPDRPEGSAPPPHAEKQALLARLRGIFGL